MSYHPFSGPRGVRSGESVLTGARLPFVSGEWLP